MVTPRPVVGDWYQTQEGDRLEVVAYDPEEGSVEVQFYDGTIEEYERETWDDLELSSAEPPEDWAGSLDLTADDYGVDLDRPHAGRILRNPLDDVAPDEEEFGED